VRRCVVGGPLRRWPCGDRDAGPEGGVSDDELWIRGDQTPVRRIFLPKQAPEFVEAPDLLARHSEQLWDWLETAAGGPGNAAAITHNANYSNGQMYNPAKRRPGDRRGLRPAQGTTGAAGGDVPEQGSSETTPALSLHDSFVGFAIVASQAFQQVAGASTGSSGQMRWAGDRPGLQEGLRRRGGLEGAWAGTIRTAELDERK
jgi:hypothetical protein